MPELPEVETVCQGLRDAIPANNKIAFVQLKRRDLRVPIQKELPQWLLGQTIRNVRRRAKYLLFDIAEKTIISHLGMSGSWRFLDNDHRKHDHCYIHFSDGKVLAFHDPRRFGLITCVPTSDVNKNKFIKHLGVEPLEQDFNVNYLLQKAKGKIVPVKNFLMDQKIVVGIGNIYASEILFHAGVRPLRKTKSIKQGEWIKIISATVQVLNKAIQRKGTTLRDYEQSSGESGHFQSELFAYGRDGERCKTCHNKIQSKMLSGRSTYWCSQCQK